MNIVGKLKMLWTLNKEVSKMKVSEIKTSEGRLALLLNIITVYSAVQGILPPTLVAKIAMVSVSVYTIGRAAVKFAEVLVKLTKSEKDDKVVAEVGALLDVASDKVKK